MIIPTYTAYGNSCVGAKRIYSDVVFKWTCPECGSVIEEQFNQVPLVKYGDYCHVFCCSECEWESKDKMYTLHNINEDSVDITPSSLYSLKVYKVKYVLEGIMG